MASECPVTVVHRVCSWCGSEFARETWFRADQAEITTWGICPRCLEPRMRDGARRGKEGRRAARRPVAGISEEAMGPAAREGAGS